MEKIVRIKLMITAIAICVAVTFLAVALVNKYTPSETMRSLDNYYDTAPDEAVLLLETEISEERALLRENRVYFSWNLVASLLNDDFYLDEAEGLLSYALPMELLRVPEGETYYYTNGEVCEFGHTVFFKDNGQYYLSAEFVALVSNVTYQLYENPNRVVVHYQWTEFLYYDTKEEAAVRFEPDIKSDILRNVPAGEKLYYISGTVSRGSSFIKIMTEDGIFGYVQKKFLSDSYYDAMQSAYIEPEYTHIALNEPVRLGWHQVTVQKANGNLEQVAANAASMNVISPTWYRLTDTKGSISSLAEEAYVKKAHQMGLQVWALIDNFDSSVSTYELFSSSAARDALIDNMMQEAKRYGFDGWNIDFETLASKTGPHYVQFIKELSIRCRMEGLVLSIDNHVPATYNAFYDLETQGKVADYVIIMAYDEHYSGSDTAGSVASIGFLKRAVNNTLASVPKERIVMGIPFYTRLWAEQETDGVLHLSSEALTMNGAAEILKQNEAEAEWNEETSQNYAEFEKDGITYKVWLEDEDSLRKRLEVISEADLAGVAAWRLGFETKEIWPIIEEYIAK